MVAFRLERHLVLLEHLFDFMALHTAYFHHGYHSLRASEADIRLLREVTVTGISLSACLGVSSRNAPSVSKEAGAPFHFLNSKPEIQLLLLTLPVTL